MGSADGIKDPVIRDTNGAIAKGKKRTKTKKEKAEEITERSRKVPKRAAACSNFKEKAVCLNEKECVIELKKDSVVEDEVAAISLTSGNDIPRPNRRLSDFVFHDEEGKPQPVEMLEVSDLYITGVVLPLEPDSEKIKEKGVRCEGFGRIETWSISGYEDGSPVIWVSTELADYDCGKPSASYRKIYGLFYEKARACIEVYKQVCRKSGGNPDICLDELVARIVRSMNDSKYFHQGASVKEFLISQGEFIYNQLVGLDETSEKNEQSFVELSALIALRDECERSLTFEPENFAFTDVVPGGSLKIGVAEEKNQTNPPVAEEDEDVKLARLLQEEEYWQSMTKKNKQRAPSSNRFYIKINEDEIANDYPLPSYFKPSYEETDEYIIFDSSMDICDPDDLPKTMLHNWSLYNSDSRLISLELLPMKPCADIDVTIFGSGIMTDDDGSGYSGFSLDAEANQSSSASAYLTDADGIPIYLSAIKEWMVEFGASMIFISIRTDMAWYRLGKPSKQYAPWYETEQSRVARLSFSDIIKKLSELSKDHPAFISSNPAVVERYVVVHGQIILQQFALYPDDAIRKSAFGSGLQEKMLGRHHTKWLVKKKSVISKGVNLNPRATMTPVASKRSMMPATTTRLINRIWGEFYSNYAPEILSEGANDEHKEDIEAEDETEEVEEPEEEMEDKASAPKSDNLPSNSIQKRLRCSNQDIQWNGEPAGKTCDGETLYQQAYVRGELVAVGGSVVIETLDSEEFPLYFVEYMCENLDGKKMVHGRLMVRGSETILGNAASEREVFLTKDCLEFELGAVKQAVKVEIRLIPWGFQYRKANAVTEKADKEKAEERKKKGLPLEYYCKSLYSPQRGAFLRLPNETMGVGSGICYSCKMKEKKGEKEMFKLNTSRNSFAYKGTDYKVEDFVYIPFNLIATEDREIGTFKSGRNVGLKPYAVCQLLEIVPPNASKKINPESVKAKVRRFFRPEDISLERAYRSDIREVYYSEQVLTVTLASIEGKCEVRKKHYIQSLKSPGIFEHIFFCEHVYDPKSGAIKQLPSNIKLSCFQEKVDDSLSRKKKGKSIEGETDVTVDKKELSQAIQLATLDIFAGCGGLSEGLQQSGISRTKWAIEYEEPAGEAFSLNHTEATMFINNCNVILKAIMSACGDEGDCISTPEAAELAGKLDEKIISNLPKPGQVDFINGGPPCQGFSGMNRFNQGIWSKVQCEMILAFLSFADYFRPRYFLLENVRNFVSFNKGQTFRLAVASLLEMGYQVRYGILEAGAFGVSQSRKRAFIWAASPEDILPEWPEPMHVFASPQLKITLDNNVQYAAVRSTSSGAPFRSITVRDTIGDLPPVENGAFKDTMEYKIEPVSWFQKLIRGDMVTLTDHISKEMNELNLIRCQRIPKRPGADWRDLPDEKVRLSTGQMVDLIPWCLPNTAERHNQWKGLFGRLDWEGNFPTSITDPQPMGKVGMCFHPDQDRIVTVRECARTQGFPDRYKFFGSIHNRHRQIGNAVPPPLAFALGRKLKEAVEEKTNNPTGLKDSPYL
ncbi:hypothetical protein V2J09_018351 [Rumex salicifolius]